MKSMRLFLALATGKAMIYLSRLLGNQGTDIPGRWARRIYPGILQDLAGHIQRETIVITGTNGKTTTANLLAAILTFKGSSYIHNSAGANMLSGITTAYIKESALFRRKAFDYAILETDEANVPLLLKEINPEIIVVTNFFRDQLDRYGELDRTINLIKEAVKYSGIKMLLNADDPLMAHLTSDNPNHSVWYYGFEPTSYDTKESDETREGRFCLVCGQELQYSSYHYAQLGRFYCPQCNLSNPLAHFKADHLVLKEGLQLTVNGLEIKSPYQEFYNAYNILAGVSAAKILGIEDQIIQKATADFKPQAGRMEEFLIAGKKVILALIKNPTGFNQTLAAILRKQEEKNLFIALNDNAADGRDISWIWDTHLEMIDVPGTSFQNIVASGLRSGDMALRIKYAGVDPDKIIIESDLERGMDLSIKAAGSVCYILCTYTALFTCRKILSGWQERLP